MISIYSERNLPVGSVISLEFYDVHGTITRSCKVMTQYQKNEGWEYQVAPFARLKVEGDECAAYIIS